MCLFRNFFEMGPNLDWLKNTRISQAERSGFHLLPFLFVCFFKNPHGYTLWDIPRHYFLPMQAMLAVVRSVSDTEFVLDHVEDDLKHNKRFLSSVPDHLRKFVPLVRLTHPHLKKNISILDQAILELVTAPPFIFPIRLPF